MDGIGPAWDSADVPFVFDNTDLAYTATGGGEDAARLAEKISSAWLAFARTGKPIAAGLPAWAPYTQNGGATMVFDNQSYVMTNERVLLKAMGDP